MLLSDSLFTQATLLTDNFVNLVDGGILLANTSNRTSDNVALYALTVNKRDIL
jgi:predicted ATPase